MAETEYHQRILAGLCGKCGKGPPTPGFATCADCRLDMLKRYYARVAGNPPKKRGRPRVYQEE